MPGSLLGLSKVRRSESGRSDRSDISAFSADSRNSGKKVSFNRAVRVKKYPRRGDSNAGDDGLGNDQVSPEKRFWFKVYKNRHPNQDIYGSSKKKNDLADGVTGPESILTNSENRDEYAYGKLHPIAETSGGNYDGPRSLPNLKLTSDVGVGTETGGLRGFGVRKHSSQLPADPPLVRPNYVKKIVNKFNDEAVIKFHRDDDVDDDEREEIREKIAHSSSSPPPPTSSLSNGTGYIRNPPEPPVDYGEHSSGTLMKGTSTSSSPSRSKRLVNGVKVIFGMTQLKKRDDKSKSSVDSKNKANLRKSQGTSTRDKPLTNGYGILSHKGPYKTSIVLADENAKALRNASKQPKTKEAGTLTRHYSGGGGGVGSNWELNNNLDDDKRLAVVDGERRNYSSQPIDVWNSGDQLVSDRSRFETSVDKTSDGRFYRSSGEQSKIWRNERRTVYEEESDSPVFNERRAKSHGDLRMENGEKKSTLRAIKSGKVLSSEELYKSPDKYYGDNKDYRYIKGRATTKDKGIQCYSFDGEEEEEGDDKTSNINRYRVIRSKDGYVSAFSDVPSLDSDKGGKDSKNQTPSMTSTLKTNGTLSSDAIYSLVDKSKKKKKQAYVTPTTRAVSPAFKTNANSRGYPSTIGPESTLSGSDTLRKVKQTQKGFGFRLKKAFGSSLTLDNNNKEKEKGGNTYKSADENDDNWYDVDADVEAAEKRGKSNGIIKPHHETVRSEPEDDLSSSASNEGKQRDATPSSVIREMNHKKREISYENVPHLGASHGGGREISAGAGGLWFRDAEEDYRREMAQSDVSYPSGNHVGNNNYEIGSSATLSRLRDKGVGSKDDLSSGPKSYTMDRRHASAGKKSKGDKNEVKILLNGHEIDDVDRLTSRSSKNRRSQSRKKVPDSRLPSSVQSDPVHHRGGLAAAYKARQKAALKRSNSAATTSVFGSRLSVNSPSRTRRGHSSGGSAVDSSDSDSTRRRRTLVMYIPGISHPEHRASDDDKLSRVSRTQSMYSAAKPPRYQKNPKTSSSSGGGGGGGHHGKITAKSNSDLSEEGDTITPLRSEIKRKSKSPGDSIGRSAGGGGGRNRDLRRRHSIPKDTKFGWLKWKIKGKPAKET